MAAIDIPALAARLAASSGIAAKADIGTVAAGLSLAGQPVAVGDDCAALPDGDGFLLFAIEGFINEFVAADPWFAGWCGVMVNISDVAAMGGRPVAVVDAVWANGEAGATPVLEGLRAAARAYGVPIVGGHTNIRTDRGQLSVAILGRAKKLLTSFDAKPGNLLIAAIDHRGRYREPFNNWQAATDAPPARLRGDLEILPEIAEAGLAFAAKDISQGGIPGTAIMLAECSGVGIEIDVSAIPVPDGVVLDRWLATFPSFGYLISTSAENAEAVLQKFTARSIVAAVIGTVTAGSEVAINADGNRAVIRDHAETPLLRLGRREDAA
ncbi:sll0787 family AIR synthase-like protein [Neorhizobium petrolearium]|uniref:Sll0787 family AIR synthase-like protein n=1 Tax=Neorhizobium petrolearium TaxID=515361 RepID=A0ABY8LY51_9HYPH|nr:sll0787 family AIR synthase-like protein [Neorhizobium petrolearium]MCC2612024.1 sll0787 family AIR synthase-like protein [Neorhizobium petrolearium]WGI67184.1 sll0787 family AIR synthase-like protein [Neorhizobium petrolearium]